MDTSTIRVKNTELPGLLSRIGEALGSGDDLEITESLHSSGGRYLYTRRGEGKLEVLSQSSPGTISPPGEGDLGFSDSEIEEMDTSRMCPDLGDEVDVYFCNHLCPKRGECGNDK